MRSPPEDEESEGAGPLGVAAGTEEVVIRSFELFKRSCWAIRKEQPQAESIRAGAAKGSVSGFLGWAVGTLPARCPACIFAA